jgi:N-acetylglucosaminyldiphosphoundecaprenol N-acetyl-beta-D-mannosaminyltransferase
MALASEQSRVSLMGLDFDALTETEAVDTILDSLEEGQGGWVVTPNLEYLRAYQLADDIQREFDSADLVVPDGMPLLWASRLKNEPLPGRVAGSDLIWSLSRAAASRGPSLLFFGGQPGTAEAAAARLRREYPGLRVRGAICPPHGFELDQAAIAAVAREAAALRPDIVFVGLPLAKYLLVARALRRELPRAWVIGVGVSFSFVSGDIARAPGWLQHLGLEWLHRLAQEPRRLFRRYVIEGLPFALRLLAYSALVRAASALALRPDRVVPRGRPGR